jgi:hypothetical protein
LFETNPGETAMHDIDRTQLEFTQEAAPFQSEEFEFQEFESGPMQEMSENEEIQLAHELLAVNNEQELEQFLGDFIKKAVSTVGQIARSPVGQAIGGVLKGVARKALPMAGAALGGYIGGPLGAKIGTGLANAAGKAIGLELEFGESEELEFTGARQFVRLANDTARQAARAVAAGADPRAAAQQAAISAARKFAPGLLGAGSGLAGAGLTAGAMPVLGRRLASGRWIRQGRSIIVYGA